VNSFDPSIDYITLIISIQSWSILVHRRI